MTKQILGFLFLTLFLIQFSIAQNCEKLGHKAHDKWFVLDNMKLSNDGTIAVYERNPYQGDGVLIVQQLSKLTAVDTIPRAKKATISQGSAGLAFAIYPPYDTVKRLKIKGVKKDELPKDSMGVFLFANRTLEKIPQVKSFQFPDKHGNVLVWLHESGYEPEQDQVADSLKPKKKKAKKDDPVWMGIWDLEKNKRQSIKNVKQTSLAEMGSALFYAQKLNDTIDSLALYRFDLESWTSKWLFSLRGEIEQFQADKMGDQLALVVTKDTIKRKVYQLTYWSTHNDDIQQIDTVFNAMPEGFHVSPYARPAFSDDQQLLYLGMAPKPLPEVKDSLTDDEKVRIDIWNWKDQQLQSQQIKQLDREKKRSYLAAFYPADNKLIPLASKDIPDVRFDAQLNPVFLLGSSDDNYEYLNSWEQTRYADYYRINRLNGDTVKLLSKANSIVSLSPKGDFLLFYDRLDSSWYSKEIATANIILLANKTKDIFYDAENDVPNESGPLGLIGWTEDGKALVYSAYGIWQLDPASPEQCKRILGKESAKHMRYTYLRTDPDEKYLPKTMLLSVFDKDTKQSGFARFNRAREKLAVLHTEDARLSGLIKAKNAETWLFRSESFIAFPDYYLTHKNWKKIARITDANPQQQNYCWGSVEIVSWVSYANDSLDGLMYLPAGYKDDGSYPVLVYFYERNSDNLHRHYAPKPSRSVINFSDYTSRGYGVFVPDIVYRIGEPGQSAYDAIMSGVDAILKQYPGLDSTRMGLQGQSWGGYQTAWLITRTDRFKAAMAGAPVSNMTSAYGGIRWGSGMVRAFQYEDGQSRIGKDLWSDLDAYIENSPLFYADKVNTPLLMMHNDEDGAVPWYQGIEYFTALRRLQKPVWMLVYNGAPHNLSRFADTRDFTLRLEQFFDHFLMGAPEPKWMSEGVKAIDKGREFGFGY
jgi:dipeptidyl aminopeptidase/acylaminoacyl peptidase